MLSYDEVGVEAVDDIKPKGVDPPNVEISSITHKHVIPLGQRRAPKANKLYIPHECYNMTSIMH